MSGRQRFSSSAVGRPIFGQQFDALDHLGRRVGDLRAGADVVVVREHGAVARAALHPDGVLRRDEPPHHGRRERDAPVERPALAHDSDVHTATGRVRLEKLRAHRVQRGREHLQHGAHEREPEGVILLAGMAQPRAVERQRVDRFERPRLKLLAVVAGDRRPAEHLARVQRRHADRMARRHTSSATLPEISR